MTKTALFKLLLAIVITLILILPEYFKTPEGNILELSCLEVCLQPNLTYSLSSLNFSYVTFLEPVRETETIMGIFLNHSSFQNFTRMCQDITNEFTMCASCLVCESKGNVDFISQEQTSQVLIMRRSMEVKANDFHSACQHLTFTVEPGVDHLEEYNITCNLEANARSSAIMEEDPTKGKSMNHTCRIMNYPNNCIHISLHLEMDVKMHPYFPHKTCSRRAFYNTTIERVPAVSQAACRALETRRRMNVKQSSKCIQGDRCDSRGTCCYFYCSMKITWYILVILVFIFLLIFTIHKILEVHRQMQKWQSHKYKPSSILLRRSDSEKLRMLNVQALSGTVQRLPLPQIKEVLSPIPELEVPSPVHQQEQYMRRSF